MASRTDPDGLREQLGVWLRRPEFVRSLLGSAALESLGGTIGRASLRRTYQLNWRGLVAMIGEERLQRAVRESEAWIRDQELTELELAALGQALRYADDPHAAESDLNRWGTTGSET